MTARKSEARTIIPQVSGTSLELCKIEFEQQSTTESLLASCYVWQATVHPAAAGIINHVALSNLVPNAEYYYRVCLHPQAEYLSFGMPAITEASYLQAAYQSANAKP